MYVCMYVCMYLCTYVRMYMYVRTYVCVCIYVHMCACMYGLHVQNFKYLGVIFNKNVINSLKQKPPNL